MAFEPGTQWRYGFSTDVIGAIIEVVSGMSLGDFYQKELFGKLDMKDTGFYVPTDKIDRFAKLYTWSDDDHDPKLREELSRHLCLTNSLKQPGFESAGAGLVSTTDDYAHFAQMLMQNGSYKGQSILGRKIVELLGQNLLSKEQMKDIEDEQMKGYGYGNFMRIYLDMGQAACSGTVGEMGWDGWTGTYFTVNPKEKFSIIMMLQRCEYVSPALMRKVRNVAYALLDA
ncbi:MAG TPA: serine hydrolase [Epulopiscium sp.]|nr:serine hydrolase [Candidatus Epulonipiscium sp.]